MSVVESNAALNSCREKSAPNSAIAFCRAAYWRGKSSRCSTISLSPAISWAALGSPAISPPHRRACGRSPPGRGALPGEHHPARRRIAQSASFCSGGQRPSRSTSTRPSLHRLRQQLRVLPRIVEGERSTRRSKALPALRQVGDADQRGVAHLDQEVDIARGGVVAACGRAEQEGEANVLLGPQGPAQSGKQPPGAPEIPASRRRSSLSFRGVGRSLAACPR